MGRVKRAGASLFLATAMVASVVGGAVTGPANAAITPGTDAAGALAISQALANASANVTGASYVSTTGGTPNGTSDSPLAGFPTDGSTFGILTSGDVNSVPLAGTFAGTSNGGGTVRGDSDLDVSILKTDFTAPAGANCLTFDFKFLSEEYPVFVGGGVNDAFIAELDTSNWTTASSVISAPNNFAFDGAGEVVSVNSTGVGGMTAADGAGTAYDGITDTNGAATGLLQASRQVTPGAHSLYFSLFDQGDTAYDSAVFLDNLVVGFVANPEVNCVGGATPVTAVLDLTPATATNPTGTQHTVTATLKNSEGAPIVGASIGFTVAGVNPGTGSSTTNATGEATFAYTGTNAGTDQISACYNADNAGPCEADASATKEWTGVEPSTATLNVNVTGSGSVVSDPSGITCPTTCAAEFNEESSVALTPTPAEGFVFSNWSGACSGSGACNVTMNGDQTVGAVFTAVPVTRTLDVSVTGAGSVSSDPAGIDCGATCSADFEDGATVTLTATADEGSQFAGWGGACEATGTCVVNLTANTSVTATFEVIPPDGDLGVTEVSDPPTVTAGNNVQQTFTVTNGGASGQTNTSFTANFPAGSTVVSSDPSQGSCTAGPATLTCSLGTIGSGGSVTIPVIVTVPAGFPPGVFAPTASATSDQSSGEFGELPGSDVVAPGDGQAFGFVEPGETLTTGDATPENPTAASFTLPGTGGGVPIALIAEPTTPTYCGGQPCRGNLMFLSPFEGGYDDPNNAPKLDLSIDASVVAEFGPSYGVWVQKEDPNVAPTLVPDCKKVTTWEKKKHQIKVWYPVKVWQKTKWGGYWKIEWKWKWVSIWKWEKTVKSIAVPSPCVAKRFIDDQGDAHVEILVLSGDPKFGRR